MSGFEIEIHFGKAALIAQIEGIKDIGIAAVATEALKDANKYVRKDTGELERSSIRASRPGEGLLVWDEPYAKKNYYIGSPSTDPNPNASLLWAHKGYSENHKKYEAMLQKISILGR